MKLRFSLLGALVTMTSWTAFCGAQSCADLKYQKILASQIGLPTHGAIIHSAHRAQGAAGGYCRVLGLILSMDPKADPIRFEVNLPEAWNGKAVQFGGGGFNGYLRQSDGRRWTVLADKTKPTPLDRGYTTFGSDSGHHHHYLFLPDIANITSATFERNDEERNDLASDALKKTHDVALALMQVRYSALASRMYFVGGSTGGREAMKVVDRWPKDYDGVLAAYAAWNQIETDLQFIRITQAMYTKGRNGKSGWLPPDRTKLLRAAVMNTCDLQDGLQDDIISNPASCHFDLDSLHCKDGRDHNGCLSNGQERIVSAFSAPQITSFSVANGIDREPGYNILRGADLLGNMGWLRHPFRPAIPYLNSFYYVIGDSVVRSFLTGGPQSSLFDIDPRSGSAAGHSQQEYLPRVQEQFREDDASLADLSAFQEHGGKLLLVHGVADPVIPTGASVLFYTRIVAAMGQQRVDSFVRLYLIPGFGHGQGVSMLALTPLPCLTAGLIKEMRQQTLLSSTRTKDATRTRPMCVWPSWARFTEK